MGVSILKIVKTNGKPVGPHELDAFVDKRWSTWCASSIRVIKCNGQLMLYNKKKKYEFKISITYYNTVYTWYLLL